MSNKVVSSVIFDHITRLDSLRQERLFLKNKYKNHNFDLSFINSNFPDIDCSSKQDGEVLNIFDLFILVGNNETLFKKVITKHYLLTTLVTRSKHNSKDDNGGEIVNKESSSDINLESQLEFYKSRKLFSKITPIINGINLRNTLIIKDVLKYYDLVSQIEKRENGNETIHGENTSTSKVSKFYTTKIIQALLTKKRGTKSSGGINFEGVELDKDVLDLLGISESDFKIIDNNIEKLAWQYDFFKKILKSASSGYVFTRRELVLINDVINDLKKGSVVMFTGDTGSGKTELARFLCKEFLGGEYVFVSGSRDLEVSDVTIEKSITSRSRLNMDKDIVEREITDIESFKNSEVNKVYSELIQSKEFKQKVMELSGTTGEEKVELSNMLENLKLTDKKLITEYHLMGIYKAAKLGIPCIIDEVNIIRPEVFMALNDLLTRKTGDNIQLPNALGNIVVKEGFCILLTGNDPEQNTKTKKYTSGRYNFDEASYNRLRVYAKNYLNQLIQTHTENKIVDSDDVMTEYLDENELYGVILMMLFINKYKDSGVKKLITTGKFGFEVMKRDFEGNHINKDGFLESIKQFSLAISTVQRAFAGEVITLEGKFATKSLKDLIKRKVFSMRNLIDVLDAYRSDTLPLDYHIYHEFIRHTTNREELYGLLIIFNKYGFFGNLITDNEEASLRNVELKMGKLSKNKNVVDISDIEKGFIITKQDIYKQYFGEMSLDDSFFVSSAEAIGDIDKEEIQTSEESLITDYENIEITSENILELIDTITALINAKYNFFDILIVSNLSFLLQAVKNSIEGGRMDVSKFKLLNSLLIKLHNAIDNLGASNKDELNAEIGQLTVAMSRC